jgi:DeoR/GlpR family transcriptional regulator of sugar metabolism
MHERKLLERVRGGATLTAVNRVEPLFSDKEGTQTAEKQRIAEAAVALVEDHDIIYLDGGSTVLTFGRMLDRRSQLTIVTNSLMAAAALMNSPHRLILVGGEFRALSRTLVGPLTAPVIQALNVDKAFMGTIGFTVPEGMTTTDPNEAFTKEQIMQRAGQVILLADHSKFGIPSFARSGSPERIDILVTDRIDDEFRTELEGAGVRVICAEGTPGAAPEK